MYRLTLLICVLYCFMSPVFAQTTGERLAFVSYADNRATVQIYDFDSQTVTDIGEMQFDSVFDLTWSVDGRLAFVGRKDYVEFGVYVWSDELVAITQGAAYYSDLTWSPDGRLALIEWRTEGGSDVVVWDGDTLTSLCPAPERCSQPTWSSDNRLAFTSPDGAVYNFPCGDCDPPPADPSGIVVWDGDEFTIVVDPVVTETSARNPHWLGDGKLLFSVTADEHSSITSWDGDTLTPVRDVVVGVYYWSKDGNLAVVSFPYGPGMVNVDVTFNALANTDSVQIIENAGVVDDVTWSLDGRLAFTASTDIYGVFVLDGGNLITAAQGYFAYDTDLSWSADGRLAMVADLEDGQLDVYIWDGADITRLIALPDTVERNPVWWMPAP